MNRRHLTCILNGKKGGRPKADFELRVEIPEINFVILTPKQYNSLIEKYGYALIDKALKILENWLTVSPEGGKYRGKKHYIVYVYKLNLDLLSELGLSVKQNTRNFKLYNK